MKCKEDGGQCGVGGYCDKCYWKEQAMVYKENLLEAKALFDKMTKPLSFDDMVELGKEVDAVWDVNINGSVWFPSVDAFESFCRAIEERHGIK